MGPDLALAVGQPEQWPVGLFLAVFSLMLMFSVLHIAAIVDVVRRRFPTSTDKILWLMVVIFGSLAGMIVYYMVGRKDSVAPSRPYGT